MINSRLINTKVAGGGGCTDIVDEFDPFGDESGLALYQLNGDATDESGNYNGTPTNVTYGTGVFGQAGVFDIASQSQIQLPTGSPFDDSDTIKTISCWFKLTGSDSIRYFSISDGGFNFFSLTATNNGIYYLVRNGASANQLSANSLQTIDNNWHHVAYVYDPNGIKIYLDGQEQTVSYSASGSATNSSWISYPAYSGTPIAYIGRSRQNSPTYSDGSIDQVRIFNEALTPLEVEALYTEELCICDGTVDTLDILGDGSCIATYQLDGNANDLSSNYSGEANNVSYGVGEFDLAAVFNGTSSYVDTGISSSLNSSFSGSMWVKPAASQTYASLFGAGVNSASIFAIDVRNLELGYNIDGTQPTTKPLLSTSSFTHVCFTYDNNVIKIYVNGQLEINDTVGSINFSVDFVFGARYWSGSYNGFFNGSIDQVRIFNKVLSAGEVTTLYDETACAKAACTGTTNTLDILGDGSCIAAYPLDGSPLDLSGNYNGVQTDVTYTVGEFDLAGVFNNSTSNINLPEINGTSLTNNSFSIWAKGRQVVFGLRTNASNNRQYSLHILSDSTIQLTIVNSGESNIVKNINSGTTININQWNHFVLTSNTLYVNGIELTQFYTATAYPMSISALSGDTLMIGAKSDAVKIVQSSFYGQLDQFRLFNKTLNSTEVGILFNDETPCN